MILRAILLILLGLCGVAVAHEILILRTRVRFPARSNLLLPRYSKRYLVEIHQNWPTLWPVFNFQGTSSKFIISVILKMFVC